MYLDLDKKQFEFQRLNNGMLSVTFKPFSSRYDKKKFFCLFEPGTKYYKVAVDCMAENPYWLNLSFLAEFVEMYDKQIIPSI